MKKIILLLFVTGLTACGQPEPSETVESLAANPERLKELRQQCRLDRAKLGDALCNRVAEATRKRFYCDGEEPYTPQENQPTICVFVVCLRFSVFSLNNVLRVSTCGVFLFNILV